MAQPLIAQLPLDLDLSGNQTIRVVAVNPATGATVSGVTITNTVITGSSPTASGTITADVTPLPLLVPTDSTA